MPVFVAENVLCDYTCGIYIIEAPDIEEAKRRIIQWAFQQHIDASTEEEYMDEILKNLRELKPDEIIALHGGG